MLVRTKGGNILAAGTLVRSATTFYPGTSSNADSVVSRLAIVAEGTECEMCE